MIIRILKQIKAHFFSGDDSYVLIKKTDLELSQRIMNDLKAQVEELKAAIEILNKK